MVYGAKNFTGTTTSDIMLTVIFQDLNDHITGVTNLIIQTCV